jgi:N-acyl-D-amino-acid deacylase
VFDILLRGGTVVDGTGGRPYRADVAVRAGRIAAVGDLATAGAERELDAAGCLVLPGFIDTHVHADAAVWEAETAAAMLLQGVTTVVVGQDGISFAPASPATADYVRGYFGAVNGDHPRIPSGALSVAELLGAYATDALLNVAYLVPHANLRLDALGTAHRAPDPDELTAMTRAVERALEDGAVGLSTGLEYVPGGYAATEEIIALLRPLRANGHPYVSHMRGYEQDAGHGMAEVVRISTEAGVPAHVSHYHGPSGPLAALLGDAERAGADISFDTYPYLRGSSLLAMIAVPPGLQAHGPRRCAELLGDRGVRAELRRDWVPGIRDALQGAALSRIGAPELRWAEGLTVAEASERAGAELTDFLCDLLAAARMAVGCVFATGRNAEDDLRALMRLPGHMASSDGIYQGSHPHPRGWGAFARYLRRHTVELGDFSWAQAAVHLSARAAARFGLADRGRVAVGSAADLAVVQPDEIADRATYADPRRPAAGLRHVVVNGVPAVAAGQVTRAAAGTVLRRRE